MDRTARPHDTAGQGNATGAAPGSGSSDQPALFQPFTLRGTTFANRVVVSPMCQYKAIDGVPTDWHFAHHGRFALGGVGAGMIEATGVVAEGRITPGDTGLYNQAQEDAFRRIVDLYHSQGVPVGIQLAHAGRKASSARPWDGAGPLRPADPDAWQTVAPSPIPYNPGWPVPHEMSAAEIGILVEAFAAAALRAVAAGFDFIEVHGAHGYLVHSFFSPLSNHRDDAFGGSLEKRMTVPLQVSEAVRGAIPDAMPLFYRASCVDGVEGGITIEDTIALAHALKRVGVDLVDCSSGGIGGSPSLAAKAPAPGFQVPYAAAVRRETGLATMAVGFITEPRQAETIVAEGSADLVALARQLIEEPSFALHAALALGRENPYEVLPEAYSFYLVRRAAALARKD